MPTIERNPNPRIMIRCPKTGKLVYIGKHAYDQAMLEAMQLSGGSVACPHCKETHAWTKADAVLES